MSFGPDDLVRGATLRRVGDVPSLQLSSASVHLTATGGDTRGDFGLFRYDLPPGPGGASPHVHRTFSESFYVLEGMFDFYDGTGWEPLGTGDFLYVPRSGVHAFRNGGTVGASMLILFTPGLPREQYFTELQEIAASGRTPSPEEWIEIWRRNDQFPVPDETDE